MSLYDELGRSLSSSLARLLNGGGRAFKAIHLGATGSASQPVPYGKAIRRRFRQARHNRFRMLMHEQEEDRCLLTTLSVAPTSSQFPEGNLAMVGVSASPPSSSAIQFTWQTSSGTATGNADYQQTSGTGTIAANENHTFVSIPTFTDLLVEGSEYFTFTLTSATGATIMGGSTSVTIADVPPSSVSVSAVNSNVAEGGAANIRFYASPPSSSPMTVNYQTVA